MALLSKHQSWIVCNILLVLSCLDSVSNRQQVQGSRVRLRPRVSTLSRSPVVPCPSPPLRHGTLPRAICDLYTGKTYAALRDDLVRTGAYEDAINRFVPGRVVLDIGTGGLALLAVMAARAGADHVYAVECNSEACEAARQRIAALGLQEKITVVEGYSTDVESLPTQPSIVLHEILGEVAGCEGAARCIADARQRLLEQGALSIPSSAASFIAPCVWPAKNMTDFPGAIRLVPCPWCRPRLLAVSRIPKAALLASPQVFEHLNFDDVPGELTMSQQRELRFEFSAPGKLKGLAAHIEVAFPTADGGTAAAEELALISSSDAASDRSAWPNVLLMLPTAVHVSRGDVLVVTAASVVAGEQPQYTFDLHLQRALQDAVNFSQGQLQEEALGCLQFP